MNLVSCVFDYMNNRITYNELVSKLIFYGYKDITCNMVNDNNTCNYLINNNRFIIEFNNLSDIEFINIITKYIKSNVVFQVDNNKFNRLAQILIDNNDLEKLWRLAFNYDFCDFDFNIILDYYIKIKNIYYLTELLYILFEKFDLDIIIEKVKSSGDKKFIKDFYEYIKNTKFYDDKDLERLLDFL